MGIFQKIKSWLVGKPTPQARRNPRIPSMSKANAKAFSSATANPLRHHTSLRSRQDDYDPFFGAYGVSNPASPLYDDTPSHSSHHHSSYEPSSCHDSHHSHSSHDSSCDSSYSHHGD